MYFIHIHMSKRNLNEGFLSFIVKTCFAFFYFGEHLYELIMNIIISVQASTTLILFCLIITIAHEFLVQQDLMLILS